MSGNVPLSVVQLAFVQFYRDEVEQQKRKGQLVLAVKILAKYWAKKHLTYPQPAEYGIGIKVQRGNLNTRLPFLLRLP